MNLRIPILAALAGLASLAAAADAKPHIIFVMADDMGWGQTGYRGHAVLKTPNLDAMAANGLRFERFYAAGPVCSPTRASVLTGRSHDRSGVLSHGYALRPQEKTVAQALRDAGYATGHFGKWHLNGFKGPGAPILERDPLSPGPFGFERWVSVTNFFDLNPLMSRNGKFEEFTGDSSEIAVAEALKFIEEQAGSKKPVFATIWFGTPHSPFRALPEDKAAFGALNEKSAEHYGELVAMDRSIGTLREKLRNLGIAENTLLVFCSDNGGLPGITPATTGGLRDFKGSVYEGGIRVPGIIEWPAVIKPRITSYPASTMDLFPTVADVVGLPESAMIKPVDGESLRPLFEKEIGARKSPIPFRYQGKAAWIDNRYKIVCPKLRGATTELYDLEADPEEARDLSAEQPRLAERLRKELFAWNDSVEASFAGKDYPEGKVAPPDPESIPWSAHPAYKPFLEEWGKRWEYKGIGKPAAKRGAANRKGKPAAQ